MIIRSLIVLRRIDMWSLLTIILYLKLDIRSSNAVNKANYGKRDGNTPSVFDMIK